MRSLLLALIATTCALCAGSVHAQGDSSLTREFRHLSAKERARIAKKEQEEAAADPGYQVVMREAESFFQGKRYEESLEQFQKARTLRPLNVYPKVKIQDLQALIAKRDAALAQAKRDSLRTTAAIVPVPKDTATVAAPTPLPEKRVETVHRPVVKEEAPKKPVPAIQLKEPVRTKEPVATTAKPTALADGVEEQTYVEGRAIVLERRLTRQGRVEVFRKVTHPWGQVVHFRDGVAISEREWAEVFPQ